MRKSFILMVLFLVPALLTAQETQENELAITSQIRTRAEYRNGAIAPRSEGDRAAVFVNNRARIGLQYNRNDNLSMKLSAQHVGVWGQDPQIAKNGRFVLHEAWARLKFGEGFFAQVGRQSLSYDDERLLGALDWNVAGRYHDALKMGYEEGANKLHLVLAFNQNDERVHGTYYATNGQAYKSMQTLWYHYDCPQQPLGASLLLMNLGVESGMPAANMAHTRYMQTFGTYLTYQPETWNVQAAFYYQTGKTVRGVTRAAWMANAKLGYAVNEQWKISLGYDYLSGEDGKGARYNAFDPLYGTHHKFYGAMDYFYASSFSSGAAPGLQDFQAGVAFNPSAAVGLQADYHYFTTAAKLDNLKKVLGSEVDLRMDIKVKKDVKLTVGYSAMFGTSSMDAVKGGNHKRWQDWGWVSLNINPQLLSLKW